MSPNVKQLPILSANLNYIYFLEKIPLALFR